MSRDVIRPEDQRPPSVDWYRLMGCSVALLVGVAFWIAVIFAIVEVVR